MKRLLNVSCVKIAALSLVLTMIFSYIPNALAMQENNEIQNQDYWTNIVDFDLSWYNPNDLAMQGNDEIKTQGYWTDPGNYNVEWYNNNRDAQEFKISTPEELAGLSVIVNGLDDSIEKCTFKEKTIHLTDNLNMEAHYWTPIGYNQEVWNDPENELPQNYFNGIFQGNSHTISKLQTNDESKNYQGLFGIVIKGSIKNLGIIDSNIVGKSYVGAVIGFASHECKIQSCFNNGNVNGTDNIGGVAGSIGDNSTTTSCSNNGIINGTACIGGVAGFASNKCTIKSCYNTGNVNGIKNSNIPYSVGGVVGFLADGCTIQFCNNHGNVNKQEDPDKTKSFGGWDDIGGFGGVLGSLIDSTIEFCFNNGKVSGTTDIGGVLGSLQGESKIQSCFNKGKINGIANIGGVLGCSYYECKISSCYNTGNITGKYDPMKDVKEFLHFGRIGGVVGFLGLNSILQSCYNTGDVTGNFDTSNNLEEMEEAEEFEEYEEVGGVGGVAGLIGLNSKIKYCYNTGSINVEQVDEVGGIVGSTMSFQPLFDNCYYCDDEGKIPENANQFGESMSLDKMKTQEFVDKFAVSKTINNVKTTVNEFLQSEEANSALPVLKFWDERKTNKIKFDNFNKSINKIAKQHINLAKKKSGIKSIKLEKLGDRK